MIINKEPEDIIKLDEELMTDDEQSVRAADAELFYRKHFKKFILLKEYEWLRSLGAKEVSFKETLGQTAWHQGGLAMLKEIFDWFKDQNRISLSRFENEEDEPSKDGESISPID